MNLLNLGKKSIDIFKNQFFLVFQYKDFLQKLTNLTKKKKIKTIV